VCLHTRFSLCGLEICGNISVQQRSIDRDSTCTDYRYGVEYQRHVETLNFLPKLTACMYACIFAAREAGVAELFAGLARVSY
jgi:hypothetical protein